MYVINEHECEILKTTETFAVQEYDDEKWYWVNIDPREIILNQIFFCPYCGEKLNQSYVPDIGVQDVRKIRFS